MKAIKIKKDISEILDDITWDVDNLLDNLNELRLKIQEDYYNGSIIYDTERFVRELTSAGLYSKEMQDFLNSYIRYSNVPN